MDDISSAATEFTWGNPRTPNGPSRLTELIDPVSGRKALVSYSNGVTNSGCPTAPGGFDPVAPGDMLCQVTWPDLTKTELLYASGRLARIVDPGAEVTDFGYSADGLNAVRDPLAADMVAAGRADDSTTRWQVAYSAGKASSVTGPAPTAGAPRPQRSYRYVSPIETQVDVAGLTPPAGFARKVIYDSAYRATADTDAAGITSQAEWSPEDRVLSSTAFAQQPDLSKQKRSTTIYDTKGRVTDTYGPAPASWFTSARVPMSGYLGQVAHTQTSYDENIQGLAAAYWTNKGLYGRPKLHGTGVGEPTGALFKDWGSASPAGLVVTDNWSARFTGEIRTPTAGTYSFKAYSDDGVRLYIDEKLIIDSWTDGVMWRNGTATITAEANTWHKIRLDYYDNSQGARLELHWSPTGTSGTHSAVPGSELRPGYGLATTVTETGSGATKVAKTEHATPHLGLPTASVQDPAGANLRATTTYADTYNRRTARTLPAGAASQVTYAYWGATEAPTTDPCTGAAGVSQGGLLRYTTNADPDGAGPLVALRDEVAYDRSARVSGTRTRGSDGTVTAWRCLTYDSRGRVTASTDRDGRTATTSYTQAGMVVSSFIDSSGTARSTRSQVDMLGRTVSYTDELGGEFTYAFDQAGRATTMSRKLAGQANPTLLASNDYDTSGRLVAVHDWGSGSDQATTTAYDPITGAPTVITAPNGVASTTAYDPNTWMPVSVTHVRNSATVSSSSVTRTADGRITADAHSDQWGRTLNRAYTYDGAERLTRAVDSGTVSAATRDYAYTANTNRCARAATCTTPTYTYDAADRLLSSPDWSSYVYDAWGNVTSAVRANPGPAATGFGGPLNLTAGTAGSMTIDAGQAGTISGSVDWPSEPPYASSTSTGSVATSSTATASLVVPANGYVTADLAYTQGTRTATATPSGTVAATGTVTAATFTPTKPGVVNASVDWGSTSVGGLWSGTVGDLQVADNPVVVSANGTVTVNLSWTNPTVPRNLDLYLMDGATELKRSAEVTGSSERIEYTVTGLTSGSRTLNAQVRAIGQGSSFDMSATRPVTANVDLQLIGPGGEVASSNSATAKPEVLSYTVGAAQVGQTFTLRAISRDYQASLSGSVSYPQAAFAPVTLRLKNPSGAQVATTSVSLGSASLRTATTGAGTYTLEVEDTSGEIAVPTFTLDRSSTYRSQTNLSGSLAAGATTSRTLTADDQGWMDGTLSWAASSVNRARSASAAVSPGSSFTSSFEVPAAGRISASAGWVESSTGFWLPGTGTAGTTRTHSVVANGNGTLSATLSWSGVSNLDLELLDPSGAVVRSSKELTGNAETVSWQVSGVSYPVTRTYTLRVTTIGLDTPYQINGSRPVTADVDLVLKRGSTTVATASGSSAKPETLTYDVTAATTGSYSLVASSKDFASTVSLAWDHPDFAGVRLRVVRVSDALVVSDTTMAGGSGTWAALAPAGGDYRLEVTNLDATLTVPSFTGVARLPAWISANVSLVVRDSSGTALSVTVGSGKPKTFGVSVPRGRYSLEVTSDRAVTATVSGERPTSPLSLAVTYDAFDHATVVDDGAVTTTETLAPSGRVLRRQVRDNVTGQLTEDVTFGYSGPGDNPAYSISAGVTTTYGPGGAVHIPGQASSWPVANLHGDIVATVASDGTITQAPLTDEFGVGYTTDARDPKRPDNRLGWLGAHQRYTTNPRLSIIRMGVRLYDPSLGRFLQVDPIEGGSANDYDYVAGDPINAFDLDGMKKCGRWDIVCKGRKAAHFVRNIKDRRWGEMGASAFNIGFGVSRVGVGFGMVMSGNPFVMAVGVAIGVTGGMRVYRGVRQFRVLRLTGTVCRRPCAQHQGKELVLGLVPRRTRDLWDMLGGF